MAFASFYLLHGLYSWDWSWEFCATTAAQQLSQINYWGYDIIFLALSVDALFEGDGRARDKTRSRRDLFIIIMCGDDIVRLVYRPSGELIQPKPQYRS
jgi:hypothetical protein